MKPVYQLCLEKGLKQAASQAVVIATENGKAKVSW